MTPLKILLLTGPLRLLHSHAELLVLRKTRMAWFSWFTWPLTRTFITLARPKTQQKYKPSGLVEVQHKYHANIAKLTSVQQHNSYTLLYYGMLGWGEVRFSGDILHHFFQALISNHT